MNTTVVGKDLYDKVAKLGEGTFAVVHSARNKKTGHLVAIKKIKLGHVKDGIDMSAIREVKFLQELTHPNIIRVSYQNACRRDKSTLIVDGFVHSQKDHELGLGVFGSGPGAADQSQARCLYAR